MTRIGMNVADVISRLDEIAPPYLAEDGDPIGLQTGAAENPVTKVFVAVDVTPAIIEQAIGAGAEMIISHHAIIYSPLKSLARVDPRVEPVTRLVAEDIATYIVHTNYDIAPGGVSDVLAAELGVVQTDILAVRKTEPMLKVVVFVPPEALDAVRSALATAGAGIIGNYSECSFRALGKGSFKPLKGAQPYIGQVGKLEEAEEYRLEMIVPESLVSQAVQAMLSAHPYDEPAYDIYRLENAPIRYGFGRIGRLDQPTDLSSFARRVEERLGVRGMRMVGDPSQRVERVAVCGGGGDRLIAEARSAGADVYVTGTADYHRMLEAASLGLAFIDAGHFETERPAMRELAHRLNRDFADEPVEFRYVE